jgi:hypothetical protein
VPDIRIERTTLIVSFFRVFALAKTGDFKVQDFTIGFEIEVGWKTCKKRILCEKFFP